MPGSTISVVARALWRDHNIRLELKNAATWSGLNGLWRDYGERDGEITERRGHYHSIMKRAVNTTKGCWRRPVLMAYRSTPLYIGYSSLELLRGSFSTTSEQTALRQVDSETVRSRDNTEKMRQNENHDSHQVFVCYPLWGQETRSGSQIYGVRPKYNKIEDVDTESFQVETVDGVHHLRN